MLLISIRTGETTSWDDDFVALDLDIGFSFRIVLTVGTFPVQPRKWDHSCRDKTAPLVEMPISAPLSLRIRMIVLLARVVESYLARSLIHRESLALN
jgi:hypothetical protein